MCGRYRLSRRKQIVEEYFDSVSGEEDWTPRYNIAPTQPVPVIRQNPREACGLRVSMNANCSPAPILFLTMVRSFGMNKS